MRKRIDVVQLGSNPHDPNPGPSTLHPPPRSVFHFVHLLWWKPSLFWEWTILSACFLLIWGLSDGLLDLFLAGLWGACTLMDLLQLERALSESSWGHEKLAYKFQHHAVSPCCLRWQSGPA